MSYVKWKKILPLLFLTVLVTPSFAGEINMFYETENFRITWKADVNSYRPAAFRLTGKDRSDRPLYIVRLGRSLEWARQQIYDWGYRIPEGKTTVYLVAKPNWSGEYEPTNEASNITSSITLYPQYGTTWVPLEELRVSAGHEFFHRCQKQYFYNVMFKHEQWFMEGTAAWMEDQLYPEANDCYPTNVNKDTHYEKGLAAIEYGAMPFIMYIAEKYGPDIIRMVWDKSREDLAGHYGEESLDLVLRERGSTLTAEWYDFLQAYFARKPFHPDVDHLEPLARMELHLHRNVPSESTLQFESLPPLSGRAYRLRVPRTIDGPFLVTAKLLSRNGGVSLDIYESVDPDAAWLDTLGLNGEEREFRLNGHEALLVLSNASRRTSERVEILLTIRKDEDADEAGGIWSDLLQGQHTEEAMTSPILKITEPISGFNTDTPVITVTGIVENLTAGTIILNVNGSPRQVVVNNGTFTSEVPLIRGENLILAEAGGITSNIVRVIAVIDRVDIWSELTWDGMGDVDFHLYLPNEEHCYYQNNTTASGAELDIDNTDGYGPEHITMTESIRGEYRLTVLYYSSSGDDESPQPLNWKVTVRLNDGESQKNFSGTLTAVGEEQTVTTLTMTAPTPPPTPAWMLPPEEQPETVDEDSQIQQPESNSDYQERRRRRRGD